MSENSSRSIRSSKRRKGVTKTSAVSKKIPAKLSAAKAAKKRKVSRKSAAPRRSKAELVTLARPRRGTKRAIPSAKAARRKFVYFFGGGSAEGDQTMRDLLGGKGANLAEMTNAGLPVPPGFTVSTEACTAYYDQRRKVPKNVDDEMEKHLRRLERLYHAKLGASDNPLLVSVRSGSKFSMPGMMDTILNLGLNDRAVRGLANRTSNERFALDSYRRFIQMFGDVVLEISKDTFEREFEAVKTERRAHLDSELDEFGLREVVARFKAVVKEKSGRPFPQDPMRQLRMARDAVFRSWQNPRAKEYRRIYDIPDKIGTAVNVQVMVFGNTGDRSATGVGFTRNPATGTKEFYGEFLINAQGEDVVAGIRTPQPIAELQDVMPRAYRELRRITSRLERHYKDVQDFEFTIQDDELFMLQTRNGKRTGYAAVVIATDLVSERLIKPIDAVRMVDPESLTQLLAPVFDPQAWEELPTTTRGLPASPGAACGQVVFSADDAVAWSRRGRRVLLVRKETVPDDIHGMHIAEGILTATGGMTSHAAVVGRQMGKPSVVGAGRLSVDESDRTVTVDGQTFSEGDYVSFDGLTGEVKIGQVKTKPSEILQVQSGQLKPAQSDIYGRFSRLLSWADRFRRLGVRANADLPDQAETAYAFGARGIGLCRTEHMFFGDDRISIVERMILADSEIDRRAALEELLPFQREDFYGVFKAMRGQPVTIRLIDPPLHEFLPKRETLMVEVARLEERGDTSVRLRDKKALLRRVDQLHEFNPMMGHRGVRLAISYPEISEMQTRAIVQAACRVKKEGVKVIPEIMIPLVGHVGEVRDQKAVIDRVATETMQAEGVKVKYLVGTMIEVPRGVLAAGEIAADVDFFSFGTNDLTQMTFGFSRDDAGKFLGDYRDRGILTRDPFSSIDVEGVGALVRMGVEKGREARPKLKLGVCGEHGGDTASIMFFESTGLDYVSASPYRVPTARLAAAQAALKQT